MFRQRLKVAGRGVTSGIVGLLVFATACIACDTPVYRYAMYRWKPTPYEVYFFHDQEPDESAKTIRKKLEKWSQAENDPANLVYVDVDLQADAELKRVPPDVKKLWMAKSDRKSPGYMVVSPIGMSIFDGQLQDKSLEQLVASPKREKIGKRLEAGDACVFVLLSGITKVGEGDKARLQDDKQATEKARETLKQVVTDVNDGKLKLYTAPPANSNEDQEQLKLPHHVSMVDLSRTDQAEKWLVDNLMSLEDDLYDFDAPMVFAVYGRGRALPPFIGKGVNRELLEECVAFVSGACSCTVKEQNPGVDLLMRYDWESASAAVAERFGAEEGNESQLRSEDFFPELIPAPSPKKLTTQEGPVDSDPSEEGQPVSVPAQDSQVADGPPKDADQVDANIVPNDKRIAAVDLGRNAGVSNAPTLYRTATASDSRGRGLWVVLGGVLVGVMVLFAVTLVVMGRSN